MLISAKFENIYISSDYMLSIEPDRAYFLLISYKKIINIIGTIINMQTFNKKVIFFVKAFQRAPAPPDEQKIAGTSPILFFWSH